MVSFGDALSKAAEAVNPVKPVVARPRTANLWYNVARKKGAEQCRDDHS